MRRTKLESHPFYGEEKYRMKYIAYYYRPAKENVPPMHLIWGRFTNKRDAIRMTGHRFHEPLNCATGCTAATVVNLKTGVTVAYWKKKYGTITQAIY